MCVQLLQLSYEQQAVAVGPSANTKDLVGDRVSDTGAGDAVGVTVVGSEVWASASPAQHTSSPSSSIGADESVMVRLRTSLARVS